MTSENGMAMTYDKLRILHVIVKVHPPNSQFNEHCLPVADERQITVCSFFPATLAAPPTIRMFQGDGSWRGGWHALRRALRADEHDVVHVHSPQTGVLFLVLALFRLRLANAVYTVHNSYLNYRPLNRLLMVPIFAAYPRIVFCSDAARSSMPLLLRRLSRKKSVVVPNAVDLSGIDRALAIAEPREQARFRIVFIGRMIPIKNARVLLDAVAALETRDAEVVLIGDGPLRGELEAQAEGTGLAGRVTFTGMVERQQVYRLIARSSVYVSTSHGEGLPVAVLEAMACGRPVVLSDIPPHREIARASDVIPLVHPDDAVGFAREIDRIAKLSAEEQARLGAQCRRIVEARYGLQAMHEGYESVYRAAVVARNGTDTVAAAEGPR